MQTEIIQDYINVAQFEDKIFGMYKAERESWRNAENSDFLDVEFDDETLREIAWCTTDEMNGSMKRYLHSGDYRMAGNFANVLDDYARYRTGTFDYLDFGHDVDRKLLDAMIERLDAGTDSPRANDDRVFLSGWIFTAFGTFGLMYNFGDMIADALYNHEKEAAVA